VDDGGYGRGVRCVSIALPVAGLAACLLDGACVDHFVRTDETRSRGVSDPRQDGLGTGSGGWQRGSLTPRLLLHCRLCSAGYARAAKTAARIRRPQPIQ